MMIEMKRANPERSIPPWAVNFVAIFIWVFVGLVTILRVIPAIWGPWASPFVNPDHWITGYMYALIAAGAIITHILGGFYGGNVFGGPLAWIYRSCCAAVGGVAFTLLVSSLYLPMYSPDAIAHRKAVAAHIVSAANRACGADGAKLATNGNPDDFTYLPPGGIEQHENGVWAISCYKADGELFTRKIFIPAS